MTGPARDVHSGTYSGAIHNPIRALVRVLDSIRSPDGTVVVDRILDYYHAASHLAEFCDLLPASMRDEHLRQWSTLLYNGEPLQLIVEMKGVVAKLTDADAGWKHINYFHNNQRMDYGRYRACGWPIGRGSVEGQCKFVERGRLTMSTPSAGFGIATHLGRHSVEVAATRTADSLAADMDTPPDGSPRGDLRDSFASPALALRDGMPIFGKLLGRTEVQAAARCTHLARNTIEASTPRMAHQTDPARRSPK